MPIGPRKVTPAVNCSQRIIHTECAVHRILDSTFTALYVRYRIRSRILLIL